MTTIIKSIKQLQSDVIDQIYSPYVQDQIITKLDECLYLVQNQSFTIDSDFLSYNTTKFQVDLEYEMIFNTLNQINSISTQKENMQPNSNQQQLATKEFLLINKEKQIDKIISDLLKQQEELQKAKTELQQERGKLRLEQLQKPHDRLSENDKQKIDHILHRVQGISQKNPCKDRELQLKQYGQLKLK